MIERKIIIGLITSTAYLKRVRRVFEPTLLESPTARMLATWAVEYYDEYGTAPGKHIEDLLYRKMDEGMDKDVAEEIEEEILPDLSEEYANEGLDVKFLLKETITHLNDVKLTRLGNQMADLLENGTGDLSERTKQAEKLRQEFTPILEKQDHGIDLSDPKVLKNIRRAFSKAAEPVIRFPKQLGSFWNHQLVPGGFVSFLAPEKRGKTFWLLEMAIRASRQGKKVAFFQAGDMNEAEQLKRIGVYLNKKSNLEKYCREHYQPVRDCKLNQLNECTKPERECDYSPWEAQDFQVDFKNLEMEELVDAYESNLEYQPCWNCNDYQNRKLGATWLKKIPKVDPIEYKDVEKAVKKFFHKYNRRFKLSTHPNGTLSVNDVIHILDEWELLDDFVPDVIIIDYSDLLVPSIKTEFRHQQNQIWKDLRRLSQTPRNEILPLVISPTQADAPAYKKYRLEMSNFSEDKRKFAHVTAMYGLNQSPDGREKAMGLMRINEIVIREGDYSVNNEITVLMDLWQGRPFLGSYF